jgi:hypothetical protein
MGSFSKRIAECIAALESYGATSIKAFRRSGHGLDGSRNSQNRDAVKYRFMRKSATRKLRRASSSAIKRGEPEEAPTTWRQANKQ